ncbi:hypothetical protein Aaci_1546 [Alicyclobacillus acidocaldarius subsp. acidocaldarius DSM 446]|uniref:Uncharacterized protein n=1 Tax=Alicyclobacillus acidocaldarius subsp. acidocaldarius (strain ATCC 27009 / DSM 446 / BCRC 14685 / JCM 5260 / KCTC 1825 / NBRC 15652 / NCIMB 11725 / NRRL B-14509 / 104-IA) TaxID=521098 RepID=C8WWT8_ALIAD|nr:hypothetical protein Aaci_1546 [Alicyclobacillus acidocaldarius subsp. acidocaldarius DSM 446]
MSVNKRIILGIGIAFASVLMLGCGEVKSVRTSGNNNNEKSITPQSYHQKDWPIPGGYPIKAESFSIPNTTESSLIPTTIIRTDYAVEIPHASAPARLMQVNIPGNIAKNLVGYIIELGTYDIVFIAPSGMNNKAYVSADGGFQAVLRNKDVGMFIQSSGPDVDEGDYEAGMFFPSAKAAFVRDLNMPYNGPVFEKNAMWLHQISSHLDLFGYKTTSLAYVYGIAYYNPSSHENYGVSFQESVVSKNRFEWIPWVLSVEIKKLGQ